MDTATIGLLLLYGATALFTAVGVYLFYHSEPKKN